MSTRAGVAALLMMSGCLDSTKGSLAGRGEAGECDAAALKTVSYDVESVALGECGVVAYWDASNAQRSFVVAGADGVERARLAQLGGYGGEVAMAPDGSAVAWWHLKSDLGFGDGWVAKAGAEADAAARAIDGGRFTVGGGFAVVGDDGSLTRIDLATGAETSLGAYEDYDALRVTGDGKRLAVIGATTRVFELSSGALLLENALSGVVVGEQVIAGRGEGSIAWVDASGSARAGEGAKVLGVVGERVWVERGGRVVDAATNDEIPTIGIPSIVATDDDAMALIDGETLRVWTEEGLTAYGTFDSEVTALAVLDGAVLVAARGGPGEELFMIDRTSGKRGYLQGGHEYRMTVDRTGSVVAILYVPQSGVYTALDVGRPVMP